MSRREGYRSQDSLPGTTTYRDEANAKGLPRDTGGYSPVQQDGGAQDPSGTRRRERAQPADDGSGNEIRRPAQPVVNAPGPSGTNPSGNIHKDKARTKGQPGDRYNPSPIDQSKGQFRRRTMDRESDEELEAGMKKPVPSSGHRQRKQKGRAKLYYAKRYKRKAGLYIARAKRRHKRIRNRGWFKRDQAKRNRAKYHARYVRRSGGGYLTPSDRRKDHTKGKTRTPLKKVRRSPNNKKSPAQNRSLSRRKTRNRSAFLKVAEWTQFPGILVYMDTMAAGVPEGSALLEENVQNYAYVVAYNDDTGEICYVMAEDEAQEELSMDLDDFIECSYFTEEEDMEDFFQILDKLYDDDSEAADPCEVASRYLSDGTGDSDMDEPSPERVAEFYRKQVWNPQRSDDSRQETGTPGPDQATKNDYEGLPSWMGPIKDERENPTPAHGHPVTRDRPGAPGSAKVIPRGQGFVGKTAAKGPSEAQVSFAKALFDKMLKKKWMDAKDILSEDEIRKLDDRGIGELITELKKIRDEKQVWKALPYLRAGVPPRWKKKGSRVLVAAKMAEILGGTASSVHERSQGLTVKRSKVLPKYAMWLFDVSGGSDTYRVRLQAVRSGNNKTLAKADVRLSCNCNFWRWQGPEHWAKASGYLYGRPVGTAAQPIIRDPEGQHMACKHVVAVLRHAAEYRFRSRKEVERLTQRRKEMGGRRASVESDQMQPLVDLLFPLEGNVAERYLSRSRD